MLRPWSDVPTCPPSYATVHKHDYLPVNPLSPIDKVKKTMAAVILQPTYPARMRNSAGTQRPNVVLILRITTVDTIFLVRTLSVM